MGLLEPPGRISGGRILLEGFNIAYKVLKCADVKSA